MLSTHNAITQEKTQNWWEVSIGIKVPRTFFFFWVDAFYVPVRKCSLMLGHFSVFLYFAEDICLAPGHNTVPSRPQVTHSTIESLHSSHKMSFKEFQYGCHSGHLWYWKGTILARICISYKVLGQHIYFREDAVWTISKCLPWWPYWILEWNDFYTSEDPCCPHASHKVSA